jgi:hypothetical protein
MSQPLEDPAVQSCLPPRLILTGVIEKRGFQVEIDGRVCYLPKLRFELFAEIVAAIRLTSHHRLFPQRCLTPNNRATLRKYASRMIEDLDIRGQGLVSCAHSGYRLHIPWNAIFVDPLLFELPDCAFATCIQERLWRAVDMPE